jgi:hypothetical protein
LNRVAPFPLLFIIAPEMRSRLTSAAVGGSAGAYMAPAILFSREVDHRPFYLSPHRLDVDGVQLERRA